MFRTSSPMNKINHHTVIIDLFKGFSCSSERTYRLSRSIRSYIESVLLSLPYNSMNKAMFDLFRVRLGVIMNKVKPKLIKTGNGKPSRIYCFVSAHSFLLSKRWSFSHISRSVEYAFTRNMNIVADKEIFHDRALSLSLMSLQSLPTIEMSFESLLIQGRDNS
jgi:hypothetical protein